MRTEQLTSAQNCRAVTSWQLQVKSKAVKIIEQQKNGGQRLNARKGHLFRFRTAGDYKPMQDAVLPLICPTAHPAAITALIRKDTISGHQRLRHTMSSSRSYRSRIRARMSSSISYRGRSCREMTHVQQVFDVIHNFDKHMHRSKRKMLAQCRLKILSGSDCLSRVYSFLFSSYVVTCFSERVL